MGPHCKCEPDETMDLYDFLFGVGLFLMALLILFYQNNNGVFKEWKKMSQGDIQILFAACICFIFGLVYIASAF